MLSFFYSKPKVSIVDISRVNQILGEKANDFIARLKKMSNRCNSIIPEVEFIKMAQKGLDFELGKKFQCMDFRDFNE